MRFWLGAHMPHWLDGRAGHVMVSRRRLAGLRTLPRAGTEWVLDSGGFTELHMHGSWDAVPVHRYAAEVRRFHDQIGRLQGGGVVTLAELVQLRALPVRLADTRRGDLADAEWDALSTLRHTTAALVAREQRRNP